MGHAIAAVCPGAPPSHTAPCHAMPCVTSYVLCPAAAPMAPPLPLLLCSHFKSTGQMKYREFLTPLTTNSPLDYAMVRYVQAGTAKAAARGQQ